MYNKTLSKRAHAYFRSQFHKGKHPLIMIMDALLLPLSLWLAFSLQFTAILPPVVIEVWWMFLLAPALAFPVFLRLGLYRAVLLYLGSQAFSAIVRAVSLYTLLFMGVLVVADPIGVPLTVLAIHWLVVLTLIGGSRAILRTFLRWYKKTGQHAANVVIYGAGEAGAQLAEALQVGMHFQPIAFVDDKSELHGTEVHGIRIYSSAVLETIVTKCGVHEILLAIPSASFNRRQEIMHFLEKLQVRVRTIPDLDDIVSGRSHIEDLREIDINDILGREPVPPDPELMNACITGKTVMVTGAGGSIGSEICRQLVKLQPRNLVLFESSEFNLYSIERELRYFCSHGDKKIRSINVIPLLGTVTNESKMDLVMKTFNVQTVYHAAAYKHVPLVEYNPIEGVKNNVFGTLFTARAALNAGVETFVLISTDKAVRPTNVMGATKRMAELVVQALATDSRHRTRFSMVRFGNVLGSSGSVVPLFSEQIRKGGPITLTHPEMTRYFMTIPESAQLVIQAGAMGGGGDIFVLDMGDPVRIQQLAQRMIALSGLSIRDEKHPKGDISIETTQIRPGEKLYEELLIGCNVQPTRHSRIMQAKEAELPWKSLAGILNKLTLACSDFDNEKVRAILMDTVTGYIPQCGIEDQVWLNNHKTTIPESVLLH